MKGVGRFAAREVGHDESAPGCQIVVQGDIDDATRPPVLSKSRSCRACDAMANPRSQEVRSSLRNTTHTMHKVSMFAVTVHVYVQVKSSCGSTFGKSISGVMPAYVHLPV